MIIHSASITVRNYISPAVKVSILFNGVKCKDEELVFSVLGVVLALVSVQRGLLAGP